MMEQRGSFRSLQGYEGLRLMFRLRTGSVGLPGQEEVQGI